MHLVHISTLHLVIVIWFIYLNLSDSHDIYQCTTLLFSLWKSAVTLQRMASAYANLCSYARKRWYTLGVR